MCSATAAMNREDLRYGPKLNFSVIILHNKMIFLKIINPINTFGADSGENHI